MADDDFEDVFARLDGDAEHTQAQANTAGAYGVPPSAAASALNDASVSRVPPVVGMHAPDEGAQLAAQRREQAILARSAPVRALAAKSPAHVAATKDDWGLLANLGDLMAYDFRETRAAAAGVAREFNRPAEDMRAGKIVNPFDVRMFSRLLALGEAAAGNVTGLSPFSRLGERGIEGIVDLQGPGFTPPTVDFRTDRVIPGRAKTREEAITDWHNFFGMAMMSIMPGRGGGAVAGAAGEAGAARTVGGRPHVGPEGPTFTPEGAVADAEGLAASFPTSRDAAMFLRTHSASVNVGEFSVFNNANEGVYHVVRNTPRAPVGVDPADTPIYQAQAEADAAVVAKMEDAVSSTATHTRTPQVMEEFLQGTPAGATSVWVDPKAIAAAYAEGHSPFPGMTAQVMDALATGRDVEVPMSTYLTEVSGQPYAEALRKATRFTPEGVSVEEGKGLPKVEEGAVSPPSVLLENGSSSFYQGRTRRDITQFEPQQREGTFDFPPVVSFSVDPNFARGYAGDAGRVYQVNIAKRPLGDFRKPTDVQKVVDFYQRNGEPLDANDLAAVQHGAWRLWENLDLWKEFGWEGAFTREEPGRADAGTLNVSLRTGEGVTIKEPSALPAYVESAVDSVFAELTLAKLTDAKALGLTQAQFERYNLGVENARAAIRDRTLARIEKAARAEDITPEEVAALVREAMVGPEVEGLLTDQLREFAEANGLPLDKEALQLAAKESMDRLPVRAAANVREAERAFKRTSRGVEDALLKGNVVRAFAEKQRQVLAWYQLEQAHRLTRQLARAHRDFTRLARKKVSKGLAQPFLDQLHGYLPGYGFPTTRNPVELLEALGGKEQTLYRGVKGTDINPENATGVFYSTDPTHAGMFSGAQGTVFKDNLTLFNTLRASTTGGEAPAWAEINAKLGLPANTLMAQTIDVAKEAGYDSISINRGTFTEVVHIQGVMSLDTFVDAVVASNPTFPEVPDIAPQPMGDMSTADFRVFSEFVYAMRRYGREVRTLQAQGVAEQRQALVDELVAGAPVKPPPVNRPSTMSPRLTRWNKAMALKRGYDAIHRKVYDLLAYFDNGRSGGVMERTVEFPLEESSDKESRLERETYAPVVDAFNAIPGARRATYATGVIPEHPFTLPDGSVPTITPGDAVGMALYVGEESALEKLADGLGTTAPDVLDFLDANLTKAEREFVQAVWDGFGRLAPEVSKELRADTGTGLERLPLRPWVTPDGTFTGGYIPLRYAAKWDVAAASRELERAAQVGLDPVGQFFGDVVPSKGFAEERTGYAAPLDVSLSRISTIFDTHIKYAAWSRNLKSVRRFLNDPTTRALVEQRMGPEYWEQINPFLDSMVLHISPSDPAGKLATAIANELRTNFAVSVLGFSFTTGVAQLAGYANAIGVVGDNPVDGTLRMARAFMQFYWMEAQGGKGIEFIESRSEMMRKRVRGRTDANLADALDRLRRNPFDPKSTPARLYDKAKEMALWYIGFVESRFVSYPAWLAGYTKAIEGGATETGAIRQANRAVEQSQGSGRKEQLAAVQRDRGLLSLMYAFETPFNAAYQRMFDASRAAGRGDYGQAFNLILMTFLFAPIINALMGRHGPKDTNPATLIEWGLENFAMNLTRPMLGIGPLVNTVGFNFEAIEGVYTPMFHSAKDVDFSASVVTRALSDLFVSEEAIRAMLFSEKRVERPVAKVVKGAELTGFPGVAQIARTGEYLHELNTGEQRLSGDPVNQTLQFLIGFGYGPQADQSNKALIQRLRTESRRRTRKANPRSIR